jgi:hypothetical protein
MSEFNFISSVQMISRIEEQLSSYVQQGVLDSGLFYEQIRFVLQKFGIAGLETDEVVLKVEGGFVQLPCDFYQLESAWLCKHTEVHEVPMLTRSRYVYNDHAEDLLPVPHKGVLNTSHCKEDIRCEVDYNFLPTTYVVNAVDIKAGEFFHRFHHPQLLRLNSHNKNLGICKSGCMNLFVSSPHEISINKEGGRFVLHSNLREAIIFMRYYKVPLDKESGLPLIPDNAILERAIEYHLMHYFFNIAWLNNSAEGVQAKVQALRQDRDMYMQEALSYCVTPSFQTMMDWARRNRNRFAAYERYYGNNNFGWRR